MGRRTVPREIVTVAGREFRFREYELPPLGGGEVRLRSTLCAPKHGTESHSIAGSPFDEKRWDAELRLLLPRDAEEASRLRSQRDTGERTMGNLGVGVVTEIGPDVTGLRAGDRVFGYMPVREVQQLKADAVQPLAGLTDEEAVCADPAHVALVAVRDGSIRVGDAVAVFGLGAIGLLAVQIARAAGAYPVIAVDPLPIRREYAVEHGAEMALDPAAGDVALAIKEATGRKGVDVAIETSGSDRALHDAIRCIVQCGTVVHVPWSRGGSANLRLGEEWHLNRPTLVGSQAVWSNADRSHPAWTEPRAKRVAADLFRRGAITAAGLLTPIVPFDEALAALPLIFERPGETIKLGIRFAGG
jgi:threonine dehydrogenase-like Zn-dependent dehydrogenase